MKTPLLSVSKSIRFVLVLLLAGLFAASCKKAKIETTTYHYKKYYVMEVSALRSLQISAVAPQKIGSTGKIYVYGNYLFINEPGIGIHIINNANPYSPKAINFISIPGNEDMAVTNDVLYADNFIDLLAFDISNPQNIKLIKRVPDVFPASFANLEKTKFYAYKDTVVTTPVNQPGIFFDVSLAASSFSKGSGQGGSMARFTIMNDHLYTVNSTELRLFNVNVPADPKFVSNIKLGWGIETIFPYQNKLFIGSTNGMHIYDASTPSSPKHLSTYSHFTSCDPVVVEGKYAYVTLRSGNFCTRGLNQLEVLNIEDPTKPVVVKIYPMQNPHGLGISGSNLYICEGDFGLKSFNISDVNKIDASLIQHLQSFNAKDIIPASKSLIVTGDEGVYQFNYNNPNNITLVSKINVSNK